MENYERLIMDLLQGDTPKAKYEFLVKLLKPESDPYPQEEGKF